MDDLKYDYIVIGSGPAGTTVAKTLSDNRKNSVLLLEAGENNDNDEPIRNSAFVVALSSLYFPQYFWQGETTPQMYVDNRTFRWTGGRLLGGGSSVNGEQYVRPTPAVLKEWEDFLGALWSPEEATKRFKELESYNGLTDNPAAHGYNGPLDVRQTPANPTAMVQKLVTAIVQATGFPEILDYNNPDTPIGPFTRWQLTQMPNGQRESASRAFLTPDVVDREGFGVNDRKLRVLAKSTVLRIIFTDKTATGVEFLHLDKLYTAHVNKKIIVSAGIHSPKLLMLSGIGPSDQLNAAGIPVIVSNPNVGKNLVNHPIPSAVFSTNPADLPLPPNDPNAIYVGGAFLPNPAPGSDPTSRDIQFVPFYVDGTLIFGFALLQPKSRGTVIIQSNDPLKIELGNEGFLDNPDDLQVMRNTFKIYIQNIAAKLSAIDPNYQLISPTADVINDDAKLDAYIKQTMIEAFHEMGTLRMAPNAAQGVVNSRGKVFGVENLIVADDSIIPFPVDGNTQAPAYLIGLTIAEQLLKEEETDSNEECL